MTTLHPRAFKVVVGWTLCLLFLGSVVHATESSLACPDWPTCFGTMVPEMEGGVFWEHLHRLVAGGLVLMFGLATWLARKEARDRPWIFRASLAGIGLLVVQSVFGGLTVIYQLPDLVSTTHLSLAFGFLVLATVLASSTLARPSYTPPLRRSRLIGRLAVLAAGLVFAQSVLGALVRHMDAGMACPDIPLCLGRVVPPLVNGPIIAHFTHRVLAAFVLFAVLGLSIQTWKTNGRGGLHNWTAFAFALVLLQIGLGIASVLTTLAVVPVSLHTLVAATLLAVLAHVATQALRAERSVPEPAVEAVA